jgi:hypothetical protein
MLSFLGYNPLPYYFVAPVALDFGIRSPSEILLNSFALQSLTFGHISVNEQGFSIIAASQISLYRNLVTTFYSKMFN